MAEEIIFLTTEQVEELAKNGKTRGKDKWGDRITITTTPLVCPRCGNPCDYIEECYDGCHFPRGNCCMGGENFADIHCDDCTEIWEAFNTRFKAKQTLGLDGAYITDFCGEAITRGIGDGISCRYCVDAKAKDEMCKFHDSDYQIDIGPGAPYESKIPTGYNWEH